MQKKNIIEISCIFFNSKIVHVSTDVKHYSRENKHRLAAAATCVRRSGKVAVLVKSVLC